MIVCLAVALTAATVHATEFHVATHGKDSNPGTQAAPLRTIQHAAELAQPGDTVTVHEGVYRERINPPRGGQSDSQRIVYQAAPGEKVEIKGSEVIKNWTKAQNDVWKVTIPKEFFGDGNPYTDLIRGDWFSGKGRPHHTGAVYLNGDWLIEAAKLDDVLAAGSAASSEAKGGCLLNVAWIRPGRTDEQAGRIPAVSYAANEGIINAPCTEGGQCIGWIEDGDWVRYDAVDFGERAESIVIRAASETGGGTIEIRLDSPRGELLGTCAVPNTRGWQSWLSFPTKIKPVSGAKTICLAFKPPVAPGAITQKWFAESKEGNTTIWAQFPGVDPNEQCVEINVRRAVFYPDKPGRNFITVRGFTMRQAATQWAPPTSEQIGLIGTHWSKGWIIENNIISHSVCSGIALGKHGDKFDNTSADTAEGYVKTIERAHAHEIAWTKENIGHHIVRNNTISNCEQTGIVGSMGCSFSTVTGNVIHDIHVRQLFTGAEMAGIKFHAAIDVKICGNHIYRTCRGLWLDWMAQGTRVSRNLFHDNLSEDLFVEVDHGPFLVDNNIFLSPTTLLDMSEGGAYVHNLMTGRIISSEEPGRETPYHPAHSTKVAGLVNIKGGDDRFYNNVFVGAGAEPGGTVNKAEPHQFTPGNGLWVYDAREFPLFTGGNVYYNGARPYGKETDAVVEAATDPKVKLTGSTLQFTVNKPDQKPQTALVTTERLGKAKIPGVSYENPDGTPLKIDIDYFGNPRDPVNPTPGPFEKVEQGTQQLTVCP
jgi:hypothetical protein